MTSALLALALAAAPMKVAVTGVSWVGIDPKLADVYVDRFGAVLSGNGQVAVITSKAIEQALGLERQRQLLGCSNENCLAELAGALGVDAILSGSVARDGNDYIATLRLIRALDAHELAVRSDRLTGGAALQRWLDSTAEQFRETLGGGAATGSALTAVRWVTLGVGVAVAAVGTVFFGVGKNQAAQLQDPTVSIDPSIITARANDAATFQRAGVGLLIAGAIVAVATLIWILLSQ
jgi:hypothetical protein